MVFEKKEKEKEKATLKILPWNSLRAFRTFNRTDTQTLPRPTYLSHEFPPQKKKQQKNPVHLS